MLSKIPYKFAVHAMLVILCAVLLFHTLILFQIIPYAIVWGGKLKNINEMYVFELLSLLINTLLICVILIRAGYLKIKIRQGILNAAMWFFVVVFALNTVGNLFAESSLETIVFTPLTFISAVLCFRIVKGN